MTSPDRRLLLDTHTLAWWLLDSPRLGAAARAAIGAGDHTVLVSAASIWEMATKHGRGRWPEVGTLLVDPEATLVAERMTALPISFAHARAAGHLVWDHRDPFDRMLAAQAIAEAATLVTADAVFSGVAVETLWR